MVGEVPQWREVHNSRSQAQTVALGSQRTVGTGSLIDPAPAGPRSCPHLNATNGSFASRNQPRPGAVSRCILCISSVTQLMRTRKFSLYLPIGATRIFSSS